MALSTAGSYRNYYEMDGQRYSHIIDPATGQPVTHKLVSASVITPTALEADALDTALMVMGPEAGIAFANSTSWRSISSSRPNRDSGPSTRRNLLPIWQRKNGEFKALAAGPFSFTDRGQKADKRRWFAIDNLANCLFGALVAHFLPSTRSASIHTDADT